MRSKSPECGKPDPGAWRDGSVHRGTTGRTAHFLPAKRGPNLLGNPKAFFDSRRRVIKRPSIGSLLLALIPFGGMCFSVALWDRVYPRVLGLPFNMFWPLAWLFLMSAVMSLIYHIEKKR